MMEQSVEDRLNRAAEWIREADGLLVTAGAGMGVDSGLPDFRGKDGFWRAYPAFEKRRLEFYRIASPAAMRGLPELGWGFYGHRLNLYRTVQPHEGFHILQSWAVSKPQGLFVFTSNVDGQFQKAGVPEDRVAECHGSIHYLQCMETCTRDIWSSDALSLKVDEATCRLTSAAPLCPHCGRMARPNILMFDDYDWIEERTDRQFVRLSRWLTGVSKLAVVELGAGKAIPTVRRFSERHGPHVVRVNPQDFAIAPHMGVGIAGGALEILRVIDGLVAG